MNLRLVLFWGKWIGLINKKDENPRREKVVVCGNVIPNFRVLVGFEPWRFWKVWDCYFWLCLYTEPALLVLNRLEYFRQLNRLIMVFGFIFCFLFLFFIVCYGLWVIVDPAKWSRKLKEPPGPKMDMDLQSIIANSQQVNNPITTCKCDISVLLFGSGWYGPKIIRKNYLTFFIRFKWIRTYPYALV